MRLPRILTVSVVLALLTSCGPAAQDMSDLDSASSPRSRTVASYFSPPQPDPGPTWEKDGRPVDPRELNSVAGPEHCNWQSVVMLHVGWPLGTKPNNWQRAHQFIRDPDGVLHGWDRLDESVKIGIALPTDARYTGYHLDELELWLTPSEPDGAYLRVGNDAERWPRADPPIGCR